MRCIYSKQHIEVLKESLTAKEQRAAILQTEVHQTKAEELQRKGKVFPLRFGLPTLISFPVQVDALRLRLEEKEATLNKKSKQIQEISEEKGTLNGEIHDLKDMLEVKERKINVLQKKVMMTKNHLWDFLGSL